MMFDPHAYGILVKRTLIDDEQLFKATVRELPHVDAYADSYQEAYELCIDAIENLHKMAEEKGEEFPPPLHEEEDFSGRVTLRMPKTLHREIAALANVEGVSLNQYIVTALSYKAGAALSSTQDIFTVPDHGIKVTTTSLVPYAPVAATALSEYFSEWTTRPLKTGHLTLVGSTRELLEDQPVVPPYSSMMHSIGKLKLRSRT